MLHRLWAPLDVPRMRRRGGWRQQLQTIETELEAEPARVSRLASGLLLEWADGSMSAARLQQHCSHAQEDGLTHPTVQRLASVGTAQNAHNGLMSLWWTCGIHPLITVVDSDKMTHMVLLSTWIRLLRAYLVQFSLRLGANIQNTRAFWSQFLAREHAKAWADKHFILKGRTVDDLDHVVPLTVFTDAGPFSLQKSCVVTSFSSLLAQGHEKLTKYPCGSCAKQSGGQVGIGAWDRLIADLLALTSVVGGSPAAVGDDGALWRFLLLFSKCD